MAKKKVKGKEEKREIKEIEVSSESPVKQQESETQQQFTHSYVIEKPDIQKVEKEVDAKEKKVKVKIEETDDEREDISYIS